MNINDFTQLYRRTVNAKSNNATTFRLKLDRVDAGKVRTLSHVTVENETTAYDKCRLGIDAGGRDHYLDELATIAANELAVSRSDIILGEGDVFFAELSGTTVDDVCIMTCIGWEQDL
jgi:dihydrofolate reductase